MEKNYKRTTRKMSPATKEKISQSLRLYNQTNPRDDEYRNKISDGCKSYWAIIPPPKKKTDVEDLI